MTQTFEAQSLCYNFAKGLAPAQRRAYPTKQVKHGKALHRYRVSCIKPIKGLRLPICGAVTHFSKNPYCEVDLEKSNTKAENLGEWR